MIAERVREYAAERRILENEELSEFASTIIEAKESPTLTDRKFALAGLKGAMLESFTARFRKIYFQITDDDVEAVRVTAFNMLERVFTAEPDCVSKWAADHPLLSSDVKHSAKLSALLIGFAAGLLSVNLYGFDAPREGAGVLELWEYFDDDYLGISIPRSAWTKETLSKNSPVYLMQQRILLTLKFRLVEWR